MVRIPPLLVRLFASLLLLSSVGCANLFKSRYAMDDPVYAAKYEVGAEKTDVPGKVKQAIDARFVEGLNGKYLAGGSQWRNATQGLLTGAELGYEYYPTSWYSSRVGLAGYLGPDVASTNLTRWRRTSMVG